MNALDYITFQRAIDIESTRCTEALTEHWADYHAARAAALARMRRLLQRMPSNDHSQFDWPTHPRDYPHD